MDPIKTNKMSSIKIIERKAEKIVSDFCGSRPPVNVSNIIKKLGLIHKEHDLGANVSGVLYIEKGTGIIGYNSGESPERRRFTLAHELGHYILHRFDKELFVDQKKFKVMYRDESSSTGELKQEREANAFAAAILMPKEMLLKEIQKFHFDLAGEDEDMIKKLAAKFEVSTQAMTYRIANLNLGFY